MEQVITSNGYAMMNLNNKIKARGILYGHPWCVSLNGMSLMLEIAEDVHLLPEYLPLVGYGCGGWTYHQELQENAYSTKSILDFIEAGFSAFHDNHLPYLPAVTCSCSDL